MFVRLTHRRTLFVNVRCSPEMFASSIEPGLCSSVNLVVLNTDMPGRQLSPSRTDVVLPLLRRRARTRSTAQKTAGQAVRHANLYSNLRLAGRRSIIAVTAGKFMGIRRGRPRPHSARRPGHPCSRSSEATRQEKRRLRPGAGSLPSHLTRRYPGKYYRREIPRIILPNTVLKPTLAGRVSRRGALSRS